MTHPDNPDLPVAAGTDVRSRGWPFKLIVLGLAVLAGWIGRRLHNPDIADPSPNGAHAVASDASSKTLSPGAILYQVHCAKCHGPDGRGDPEAIARLRPPPRDLAERPWRFEMTVESIRRVIADGISGTSMAAQRAALSAGDLDLLADHVLSMVKQLPIVERTFTPQQRQLAALGFDVERQPFPVPKLTIEDARGLSQSLSDLHGGWVILEFWSVSCEPCRAGMPALERLATSGIGKQIRIVPVCVDADDAQAAQEIMSQIAPGLTACVEPAGIEIAQFGVQALPTTWLIDPAGQVRATRVGRIDWDSQDVRAAFEEMLSGSVSPDNS